ncbi:MAG: hypothetical protein AB7T49_15035 [Oligoflexales bacterium]
MKRSIFIVTFIVAVLTATDGLAAVKPMPKIVSSGIGNVVETPTIKAENDLGIRRIKTILSGKTQDASSLSSRLYKVLEKLKR